jgi:hypothetical protein
MWAKANRTARPEPLVQPQTRLVWSEATASLVSIAVTEAIWRRWVSPAAR